MAKIMLLNIFQLIKMENLYIKFINKYSSFVKYEELYSK